MIPTSPPKRARQKISHQKPQGRMQANKLKSAKTKQNFMLPISPKKSLTNGALKAPKRYPAKFEAAMIPDSREVRIPVSINSGINGEKENRPSPMPINNVAPPAMDNRHLSFEL